MASSDQDEALDRLIDASPGEAVLGDFAHGDPELEELAILAQALRRSGREHARDVDAAAGWARLSASIDVTPQARPGRLRNWWADAVKSISQPRFAPFPALASAAVILVFSLLLAMPHESASAALMRDVDAMERTIAIASTHGTLSEEDRIDLERTATAVLDRVSDETILRSVPPAQVEAIAARLEEARRALITLPDPETSTTNSSALASLSAASGIVESSLSASVPSPQPTAAPPKAASNSTPKATPKPTQSPTANATPPPSPTAAAKAASTPTAALAASPTPRASVASSPSPTATPRGNDQRDRNGGDGPSNRAAPVATPSVATLLNTVGPVCAGVYDTKTLGNCRKAVEAAEAWCDELTEGARGCSSAVNEPLEAAERRVSSLSDGCKRLSSHRSQQACQDSIEKTSNRTSRDNSGNTGRGDRGD